MTVSFLSAEYMDAATAALAADPAFQGAIGGNDLSLQLNVEGTPGGDVAYYLQIADGSATMALGELDEPDATINSSYETASAISKGDMNVQMAFMTGKIKVSGNMAALMMNQAVISQWGNALQTLDISY